MRNTCFLVLALVLTSLSARAQLVFAFNFTDAAGTGFNDTTNGAARRTALQSAANTLANYFTGYNTTVTFTVTSETNAASTTLASAGSPLITTANGFQRTEVQNQIITGTGTASGTINWNFGQLWSLGDTVAAGTYDFKSTAMHEILHAMGFSSEITSAGKGNTGQTSGNPDTWAVFDRYVTNASGTNLVNTTTFSFVTGQTAALTGAPGMYFSGPNAMAANNGNRVALFSPGTWSNGSSGSHTDDGTYPGTMMISATLTGLGARTLTAIEIGIMKDLGYNVSAIPEPSTYAVIVGVSALGVTIVRRRRVKA